MRALTRVARAPGLVLSVIVFQLALAAVIGSSMRAAVGAGMGRYAFWTEGHLLSAVAELLTSHPGLLSGFRPLLNGSSLIALAFWTLLAAGIIYRLHAPAPWAKVVATGVRWLPGMVVTTLWHLPFRLVLLALMAFLTSRLMGFGAWGLVGLVATLAVLAGCTCALDLARCQVVLHGARRFHVRTAIRGYLQAVRLPAVLFPSMLLGLGQWVCVLAMVAAAIAGLEAAYAIWLVRVLSILSVVLGLTRIAVAVQAGPYRP